MIVLIPENSIVPRDSDKLILGRSRGQKLVSKYFKTCNYASVKNVRGARFSEDLLRHAKMPGPGASP